MINVINFPLKFKRPDPIPRKRVFYLGYRYVGPMLCQEVQNIFLKRHAAKGNQRYWSIIIYAGYSENDRKKYSIELDYCSENDVPDMIDKFNLEDEVTFDNLRSMGWDGKVLHTAKIKHIFHPVYDDVKFPAFAQPLHRQQFGLSTMAQSWGTPEFLSGKGLYAFTYYRGGRAGSVLMNLEKYSSSELKTVPVRIVKRLSTEFRKRNFKKRRSS